MFTTFFTGHPCVHVKHGSDFAINCQLLIKSQPGVSGVPLHVSTQYRTIEKENTMPGLTSRRAVGKPRVRPESLLVLARIARYIERYQLKGDALRNAASDELDGSVTRGELDDLIRRKLLRVWRDRTGPVDPDSICGRSWTVSLTPRSTPLVVAPHWKQRAAGV
jgi:hypothetical protein